MRTKVEITLTVIGGNPPAHYQTTTSVTFQGRNTAVKAQRFLLMLTGLLRSLCDLAGVTEDAIQDGGKLLLRENPRG